ncbi:MAG: crossover junction endodeoxyribonuclease RuvC [Desulfarculaceae bacterium]
MGQGPGGPVVIGLDPGSHKTGYAVVQDGDRPNHYHLFASGTIKAPTRRGLAGRLNFIYQGLKEVIAEHHPSEMAVEGVFTHKNARSALLLGQARGVAILAATRGGLEVHEYPPATVKKALVGTGRASKEQVRTMVKSLIKRPIKLDLDASDALALALTHLHTRNLLKLTEQLK